MIRLCGHLGRSGSGSGNGSGNEWVLGCFTVEDVDGGGGRVRVEDARVVAGVVARRIGDAQRNGQSALERLRLEAAGRVFIVFFLFFLFDRTDKVNSTNNAVAIHRL